MMRRIISKWKILTCRRDLQKETEGYERFLKERTHRRKENFTEAEN